MEFAQPQGLYSKKERNILEYKSIAEFKLLGRFLTVPYIRNLAIV